MTSIAIRQRKSLSLSAILAIAGACAAVSVVAIPAPHQPPGGFANAAHPTDPGVSPGSQPDLSVALKTFGGGIGNLADAVIGLPISH